MAIDFRRAVLPNFIQTIIVPSRLLGSQSDSIPRYIVRTEHIQSQLLTRHSTGPRRRDNFNAARSGMCLRFFFLDELRVRS